MSNASSNGLVAPGQEPEGEPSRSERSHLAMLSIFTTTFVALMGQGHAPSYALALSIVVCVGGSEILRRLPKPDDDDHGGPRWA